MTNETKRSSKSFFSLTWGPRGQKRDPGEDDVTLTQVLPTLPPLVLLSDDAAGPSVRRMTHFTDAAAAREHVDFWYPPEHRGRLIAFWALPRRPRDTEDAPVEALVLIRDQMDPELVSPLSFLDMTEAVEFIREEMRCGLDPSLVVLLWAIPAEVDTDPIGGSRVTPERPPEMEKPMHVLWNERSRPPAVAAESRPAGPDRPRSQLESLLGDLASALRAGSAEEPSPAFAGFGSPEGRF